VVAVVVAAGSAVAAVVAVASRASARLFKSDDTAAHEGHNEGFAQYHSRACGLSAFEL
jgi:hypothetical protein